MLLIPASDRLRRRLQQRLTDETIQRTKAAAVVFAPHQDDETLGCGGTIIKKREAGTPVRCVFMTDGRTSHRHAMDPKQLSRLRQEEACAATSILGVPVDDVHFLGFPDSQLATCHTAAVDRVAELLELSPVEEVFLPYRADGTPDHEATFPIVLEAIARTGLRPQILEYPVWAWNRWPWVSVAPRGWRATVQAAKWSVKGAFGLKMRGFRSGTHIAGVLEQKRRALLAHRSQMIRLVAGTDWPILSDVSDGDFLACFFQDFEVFCRSSSDDALSSVRLSMARS
jgi:LmbE family N-acetylglucosaminyl deacetylase